jgi:hypothetical protein
LATHRRQPAKSFKDKQILEFLKQYLEAQMNVDIAEKGVPLIVDNTTADLGILFDSVEAES